MLIAKFVAIIVLRYSMNQMMDKTSLKRMISIRLLKINLISNK